jgi:LemA protein
MKKTYIVIIAIVVLLGIWLFASYNGLIGANEAVNNQWAQVQTQYQRRFDLIPNLVNSVKGIMKQEQAIFDNLAAARTHYAGAQTVDDKAQAATEVEGALGRLLVITENYPQLASAHNVQSLMSELEGTENRVSVERKRYNDMVQAYNLKTKTFPSSIVAGLFGFKEHAYFQADQNASATPTVLF